MQILRDVAPFLMLGLIAVIVFGLFKRKPGESRLYYPKDHKKDSNNGCG